MFPGMESLVVIWDVGFEKRNMECRIDSNKIVWKA